MKFNELLQEILSDANGCERSRENSIVITNIEQALLWHQHDSQIKGVESCECIKKPGASLDEKIVYALEVANGCERSRENSIVITNIEQALLWHQHDSQIKGHKK